MQVKTKIMDRLDFELVKDLTPITLIDKYGQGDFLVIDNLRFTMSHYSLKAVRDSQQSRFVEYLGHGLTISLDFLKQTIVILK